MTILDETEILPMEKFDELSLEEKFALFSRRYKERQSRYRFHHSEKSIEQLDALENWVSGKDKTDLYATSQSNGFSYTGKITKIRVKGSPDYRTKTQLSYMEMSALVGFESKEHRARWVTFDRIKNITKGGPEVNPVKARKVEPSAIMDFFGQPLEVNDYVVCTDRKLVCFGVIEKFNPKSVTLKIKYQLRDTNYKINYSKYKPYAEIFKVSEEVKGQLLLMDLGMNPRGK